MPRRILAILGGLAATLAIGGTAVAGGWATIVPDDDVAPVAGEPTEIGFTVMQHGETPVSWVQPSVVIRDASGGTGELFPATQTGPTGHFVALVTVATPGTYTWTVQMPDLAVSSEAVPMTVSGTAVAPTPAGPTATEIALATQVEELQGEIATLRVLVIALTAGLVALLAIGLVMAWERRRRLSAMAPASR